MKKLDTICVQGGYKPKSGEPRVVPIVQSTTYYYEKAGEMADLFDLKSEGYFYTRLQNPTNDAVAAKIADLEGGVAADIDRRKFIIADPKGFKGSVVCHLELGEIVAIYLQCYKAGIIVNIELSQLV